MNNIFTMHSFAFFLQPARDLQTNDWSILVYTASPPSLACHKTCCLWPCVLKHYALSCLCTQPCCETYVKSPTRTPSVNAWHCHSYTYLEVLSSVGCTFIPFPGTLCLKTTRPPSRPQHKPCILTANQQNKTQQASLVNLRHSPTVRTECSLGVYSLLLKCLSDIVAWPGTCCWKFIQQMYKCLVQCDLRMQM